ncbi:hypothetical protein [Runella sp.]|uniref:hypothetical protein n=1 Tax=Runella sp. TaxID=1960881 RepID=UPI002604DD6C|nr:hypothetical protein [Runella sp.]
MKTICILLVSIILVIGCKPKVTPMSERIVKNWTVTLAKEGSSVVFTQGATGNTRPGYTNFKLELQSGGTVVFTDFDGTRFTGQWELQGDNKLVLKNLTPQPTGTSGTIEFTISDFTDASMTLTRTTANAKTGGTVNVYQLAGK